MGFQEKNAWACLLAIVLVFIPYFIVVFQQPMAFMGLFGLAVVILVALLTAFHMVNALLNRSIRDTGDVPPPDELDQLLELRAAKLSGIVLAIAVMVWALIAMFGVPVIGVKALIQASAPDGVATPSQFSIPVIQALTAIHLLFAGFVTANIAYYGSIIAGYRRLADG